MYDFALVAFMALALVKTVDFVVDQVSGLERMRSLLTFAGGIATMWLLDYSLFAQWDVAIRDETLGIWVTGFMVAGVTVVWRAMFSYLTHNTSPIDETLGDHHPLLERVS